MRGRGWNRGNYPGNNSNGNPANMNPAMRPPEEEWDPEYTPKSRKYYLVSVLFCFLLMTYRSFFFFLPKKNTYILRCYSRIEVKTQIINAEFNSV